MIRLIIIVLFSFLFCSCDRNQFIDVNGASMNPTFKEGSSVKWELKQAPFDRGSIVVVSIKENNVDYLHVRRVVGLPNESILITDEGILINGSYFDLNSICGSCDYNIGSDTSNIVKNIRHHCSNDEYFLIGDNLAVSRDSRYYGPVSEASILGVVLDP